MTTIKKKPLLPILLLPAQHIISLASHPSLRNRGLDGFNFTQQILATYLASPLRTTSRKKELEGGVDLPSGFGHLQLGKESWIRLCAAAAAQRDTLHCHSHLPACAKLSLVLLHLVLYIVGRKGNALCQSISVLLSVVSISGVEMFLGYSAPHSPLSFIGQCFLCSPLRKGRLHLLSSRE